MSDLPSNQEATREYGNRVDDLIRQVRAIADEADDFLKGRMKLKPHEYGAKKTEIAAKQNMAMKALRVALDMQSDLLANMNLTGEPLPRRRASDYADGEPRERPTMKAVEEDIEIAALKRRAGINEGFGDPLPPNFEDLPAEEFFALAGQIDNNLERDTVMRMWQSAKERRELMASIPWNDIKQIVDGVVAGSLEPEKAHGLLKNYLEGKKPPADR